VKNAVLDPVADSVTFTSMLEVMKRVDVLAERFKQLDTARAAFRSGAHGVKIEFVMGLLRLPLEHWGDLYGDALRLAATELRHDIDEMMSTLAKHKVTPPAWMSGAVASMDFWNRGTSGGEVSVMLPSYLGGPLPSPAVSVGSLLDATG
jgi:hypothetical protein